MNPLTFSSIVNTLPVNQTSKLIQGLTGVTDETGLNKVLDDTTIKRGCCMRKNKTDKILVKVKIPRPTNVAVAVPNSVEDKFTYIEQLVEIDPKFCDNTYSYYQQNTNTCDDFINSYCMNLRADYQNMVSQFNSDEWNDYAPECACYGQTAAESAVNAFQGVNVPPKCYMPNCGSATAYTDPTSRAGECNLTICNALFNASNFTAGQNVAVQSTVEQNCGQNNSNQNTQPPATPVPTTSAPSISAPATSAPTTSTNTGVSTTPAGVKAVVANQPVTQATPTATSSGGNVKLYLGLGGGMIILILIGIIIYKMRSRR